MPPRLAFYAWLLAPIAFLAYHFGPGQVRLQRDEAGRQIRLAEKAEKEENWNEAKQAYAMALTKIPVSDMQLRHQVRLAHAKARMYSGDIVEAIGDMKTLLAEIPFKGSTAATANEVRATLGAAEYYAGWLMRLEGAPAAEWAVEVDNARQQFRLLSEEQMKTEAPAENGYREDLEATIRLARMDLSDLRGIPLPKFCSGCRNVSQKCRGQCEGHSKQPSEKPKDARKGGTDERPRGGS